MPSATVRVFTAARMAAIEEEAITGARLNGTNLILVRNNEDEIDVGNVRGIPGPPGDVNQTQLAEAIATATPGCVLTTESNQVSDSITTQWYNISWNGADLRDTDNFHTTGSDVITIRQTGWYLLSGSVVWAPNNNGSRMVRYNINGTGDYRMAVIGANGTGGLSCRVPFSEEVYLEENQFLRIAGRQDSGVSLAIVGGCKLGLRFLSPA